ncbi:hypothetical protein [Peteryoungia desertarenae]|nr:hypothetical protein [Peteryoungia desertarenae]
MTSNQQAEQKPAQPNLDNHYRPIGLKAVIAAALMLKRKPAAKIA